DRPVDRRHAQPRDALDPRVPEDVRPDGAAAAPRRLAAVDEEDGAAGEAVDPAPVAAEHDSLVAPRLPLDEAARADGAGREERDGERRQHPDEAAGNER